MKIIVLISFENAIGLKHKNYPYIIEQKKRKVKIILDNLEKACYNSNSKLNDKEQILNGFEK